MFTSIRDWWNRVENKELAGAMIFIGLIVGFFLAGWALGMLWAMVGYAIGFGLLGMLLVWGDNFIGFNVLGSVLVRAIVAALFAALIAFPNMVGFKGTFEQVILAVFNFFVFLIAFKMGNRLWGKRDEIIAGFDDVIKNPDHLGGAVRSVAAGAKDVVVDSVRDGINEGKTLGGLRQ